MAQLHIQQFLNDLERIRVYSGSNNERNVSDAFKDLLKAMARQRELVFIPEYDFETPAKERRRIDGALLYSLRVPLGYWEAKDEKDDLDAEIEIKKRAGYPQDNIIFEDSRRAVLIQRGQEVARVSYDDPAGLERLLDLFFAYERPEIADFRKAVEQFKTDLPNVLAALRARIDEASKGNKPFARAEKKFLAHARETINPTVTEADVREMLIQHILTEEIFAKVFDDADFHRQNNIAKELYALEEKFFTGATKRNTLKQLEPYYAAIRTAATQITNHAQKQTFLKVIYENFYKVYNPKAADRLGVVYTPNEIVRFMIQSADWLCDKHFGKNLIDRGVEILDPATGTGTFICELLEHFRGQKQKLHYKYKEELHANEVAILPYYVANLNIEATFAAISGQYAEFDNLCFVDTLDNVAGLGKFSGFQEELFGAMSEVNVERIRRQNKRKISVIIGNPPYNAWQENYNSRNPNRPYRRVDDRIAATYIREGTAQNKNSVYDMYTRFFRWASDRLHEEGIIAFVTNRNYAEKAAFDGFRKSVAAEFSRILLIDLGGDVRANPKLSGTKNNVFGIQTGVSIALMVKQRDRKPCKLSYVRRPEMEAAEDKLAWLASSNLSSVNFEQIIPDGRHDWLNQATNEWDSLCRLDSFKGKGGIFDLTSNGTETKKDEWIYSHDQPTLENKIKFFLSILNKNLGVARSSDRLSIKWDRELERRSKTIKHASYGKQKIKKSLYRPFVTRFLYHDKNLISVLFNNHRIFCADNLSINFLGIASANPLATLASVYEPDRCLLKNGNGGTQLVSRYRYLTDGSRIDNITDWALEQFAAHYGAAPSSDPASRGHLLPRGEKGGTSRASRKSPLPSRERVAPKGPGEGARPITKDAIFHYVYAVLHDPHYREKYALNLKREFPRIPFYRDFWRWADWGERLMALHIGYESVAPWPLERTDTKDEKAARAGLAPKTILKADRDHGIIVLDSETQLSGVPAAAWDYRLGNRSGLDWILDQHKEKTPKDPTIREKFNTYRFADYKEKVVDLLGRVTRVSVETMEIVAAMKALPAKERGADD